MVNSNVFKVGTVVKIEGEETRLVQSISSVPGGWIVNPPVQGLKSWNEDEMRFVRAPVIEARYWQ